jgi:nitroreductase
MLPFGSPVTEIIRNRYSCRVYNKTPIATEQVRQLGAFTELIKTGPLGTPYRFELVVAEEQDRKALKGLGTYGLIKDPPGFIIGAVGQGKKNLEDFGYGMETVILYATGLGLGTCWLGGNFTKHSFSRKIKTTGEEIVPGVAAIGYATEKSRTQDQLRQKVKSDTRLPWEALFFQFGFENPLFEESAGTYAKPLEMLRLAPSAHNYQPWRVVQDGSCFHFYLQRTQGFGPGTPMFILLGVTDLQRMEIGIAMCHFELTARELGLEGQWELHEPTFGKPDDTLEYIVTWISKRNGNN